MMSPLDRNVEGICPAWVLDLGECLYVSRRAVAVKAAVNGVKTRECVLTVEKEATTDLHGASLQQIYTAGLYQELPL